jgi:hypothetical protein
MHDVRASRRISVRLGMTACPREAERCHRCCGFYGPLATQVRHGPTLYRCTLRLHAAPHSGASAAPPGAPAAAGGPGSGGGDAFGTVLLERPDQGLAAGQYAVFYQVGPQASHDGFRLL